MSDQLKPEIRKAQPQDNTNLPKHLQKGSDEDTVSKPNKIDKSNDDVLSQESSKKKKSPSKNLKNIHKAGVAAGTAGRAYGLMQAMVFIRNLLAMIIQGLMSAISAMTGVFAAVWAGIKSFVAGVGTVIANIAGAIGVGFSVVATTAAVLVVGVVVGAVGFVGFLISPNPGEYDGRLESCVVYVEDLQTELSDLTPEENYLQNAQLIYSVFKMHGAVDTNDGMNNVLDPEESTGEDRIEGTEEEILSDFSDEAIAGILGNWSYLTKLDPTWVEGIDTEAYYIGPDKEYALKNPNKYVTDKLFIKYDLGRLTYNRSNYETEKGSNNYSMGVGLFQIRPSAKFINISDSLNVPWHSITYQLAYIVSMGTYATRGLETGKNFFLDYNLHVVNNNLSAEGAAQWFAENYYGSYSSLSLPIIKQQAREWNNCFSDWAIDRQGANSVLAMAAGLKNRSFDDVVARAIDECQPALHYDNSSMARAAVSFAYPRTYMGEFNNGTVLYQRVFNSVYPGYGGYQSCDRCVGVAVRWSGADDNYPAGHCGTQGRYLQASSRWQFVGKANVLTMGDLLPGDVFITDYHTFMYVGIELIQKYHGSLAAGGADSVSAATGQSSGIPRSPGCGSATRFVITNGGRDSFILNRPVYSVYRMIDPQNSSKYQNAGALGN